MFFFGQNGSAPPGKYGPVYAYASKRIHTIPIVLLDPENVGVAFGISLLSCIQAEIYDGNGSYTSGFRRPSSI